AQVEGANQNGAAEAVGGRAGTATPPGESICEARVPDSLSRSSDRVAADFRAGRLDRLRVRDPPLSWPNRESPTPTHASFPPVDYLDISLILFAHLEHLEQGARWEKTNNGSSCRARWTC